jgi:hypothetical protein
MRTADVHRLHSCVDFVAGDRAPNLRTASCLQAPYRLTSHEVPQSPAPLSTRSRQRSHKLVQAELNAECPVSWIEIADSDPSSRSERRQSCPLMPSINAISTLVIQSTVLHKSDRSTTKTVAATHSQVPEYWTGSFQPACNRSLISSPALISPSSTKSAPCPPTPFNRLQLPQTSSPAYPVASIGLRLSAVFIERMGLWGDDRRPKGATSIGR